MRSTFFLLLMVSCSALGQDNKITKTFYVTATTKDNQPAKITPDQCRVAAGLSVDNLEKLGDVPIGYVIALDVSNSSQAQFVADVNVAKMLLSSVVRPQVDHGMILAFDSKVEAGAFSGDPSEVAKILDGVRPGGGTAMYDAIFISLKRLKEESAGDHPTVMFIISDGDDNVSKLAYSDAVGTVLRSRVRVYPIWTSNVPSELPRGGKVLKKFAEFTGGKMLEPERRGNNFDMEKTVRTLRGDLSSWYRMDVTTPSGEKQGSIHATGLHCGEKSTQFRGPDSYIVEP